LGLSPEKRTRYQELVDEVGNLQLLTAQENFEKSDKNFQSWLATRDEGFRRRHLILADDSLPAFD